MAKRLLRGMIEWLYVTKDAELTELRGLAESVGGELLSYPGLTADHGRTYIVKASYRDFSEVLPVYENVRAAMIKSGYQVEHVELNATRSLTIRKDGQPVGVVFV